MRPRRNYFKKLDFVFKIKFKYIFKEGKRITKILWENKHNLHK